MNEKNKIRLSKDLSRILRHKVHEMGLGISDDGYVLVDELLNLPHMKRLGYTMEDIENVVKLNDKQRFTLKVDESSGSLKIRANQGHSIKLEKLELKKIYDPSEIPICVHGTYLRNWPSIKDNGLHKCNRTHIHLAQGIPGDENVISGMRSSCQVVIYINVLKAIADGLEFYESSNKVILCAGNSDGYIEPKYFKHVCDRKGKTLS